MARDLSSSGADYLAPALRRSDLARDPFAQFDRWLTASEEAGIEQANAMVLATAGSDGVVSARTVLLKGYDDSGFLFFTNYRSRKARQLEENPRAAGVFLWMPLRRQVRIEGSVERASAQESDAYFATRPPGARLSAAVSPQSEVVPEREWLERRVAELAEQYGDGSVPRPPFWGGYRLVPDLFEFWQGRPSRLHDRFRYRKEQADWVIERLAP